MDWPVIAGVLNVGNHLKQELVQVLVLDISLIQSIQIAMELL
jgi:hypothetical protein